MSIDYVNPENNIIEAASGAPHEYFKYTLLSMIKRLLASGTTAGQDTTNATTGTSQKYFVSSAYSPSIAFNGSLASPAVTGTIKAAPSNLLSLYALNANAAKRYFQVHNRTTGISPGDVPTYSYEIPAAATSASGAIVLDRELFGNNGTYLSTGFVYGISTTQRTYTAATAADHYVEIRYV